MPASRTRKTPYVLPMVILSSASIALFICLYALDRRMATPAPAHGLFHALIDFDVDTLQNTLGNMAQVVAAVIGIVITVASIIVQLAATRYTPRIADLFFRDRTNLLVLGFFVVSGILAVWVSVAVTRNFVPRITIVTTLVLVTMSLLLMVPYFAYVFDFLDPEKVVRRIREQAIINTRKSKDMSEAAIELQQLRTLAAVEQLADIAVNAVSQKDKAIASDSIDAIKDFAVTYLHEKQALPKAWFRLRPRLRENPEFVALALDSVTNIEVNGTWLEWKCLRQLQSIYLEAMGAAPDISQLVAIDTRYVGEAALHAKHLESLALTLKFFNTFLRGTLNARDVRAAYNLLNQYRQLAELALRNGEDAVVIEIAQYFRYYGQIAQGLNLSFITETIAYDLGALCEHSFVHKSSAHERLLAILLDLDQQPDDPSHAAQEATLRGVRKAQTKLAAFYMANGQEEFARQIYHDMHAEHLERLRSIFSELLAVESKEYWEVIDRGTNFDYLLPPHKEQLKRFVSWFQAV